jgi:hypothetical protein
MLFVNRSAFKKGPFKLPTFNGASENSKVVFRLRREESNAVEGSESHRKCLRIVTTLLVGLLLGIA